MEGFFSPLGPAYFLLQIWVLRKNRQREFVSYFTWAHQISCCILENQTTKERQLSFIYPHCRPFPFPSLSHFESIMVQINNYCFFISSLCCTVLSWLTLILFFVLYIKFLQVWISLLEGVVSCQQSLCSWDMDYQLRH